MPKTNGKLTLKQRAFLKELSKTLEPTEAAFQVYNCKDKHSASQIAYENLIKLEIPFVKLMERMGLTDEEDIKDLKRLRKAQKIIGYLHQYKKDKNGKIEKISADEVISNEFINVDDNQTQLKALELTQKIKGRLKETFIDNSNKRNLTLIWKVYDGNGRIKDRNIRFIQTSKPE